MDCVLGLLSLLFAPLVGLLSHPDWETRQDAESVLRWCRPLSEPSLLAGLASPHPEVAYRCRAARRTAYNLRVAETYYAAWSLLFCDYGDADGLPWLPEKAHAAYANDPGVREALTEIVGALRPGGVWRMWDFNPAAPRVWGDRYPDVDDARFAVRGLPCPFDWDGTSMAGEQARCATAWRWLRRAGLR